MEVIQANVGIEWSSLMLIKLHREFRWWSSASDSVMLWFQRYAVIPALCCGSIHGSEDKYGDWDEGCKSLLQNPSQMCLGVWAKAPVPWEGSWGARKGNKTDCRRGLMAELGTVDWASGEVGPVGRLSRWAWLVLVRLHTASDWKHYFCLLVMSVSWVLICFLFLLWLA